MSTSELRVVPGDIETNYRGLPTPAAQLRTAAFASAIEGQELICVSTIMRRLITQAVMTAPALVVATIEGEPGTGKTSLARFLHSRGNFAAKPFVKVQAKDYLENPAQYPAGPVGMLYLDHIENVPPELHGRLLSLVSTARSGGNAPDQILASSTRSLRRLSASGTMDPVLVKRLCSTLFVVPRLNNRREDIGPLAQHFAQIYAHQAGQPQRGLGAGTLVALLNHEWSGNVRELEQVLENAYTSTTGDSVKPQHLEFAQSQQIASTHEEENPTLEDLSLDTAISEHVAHVLELTRGNKLRAASLLRISRSTLYRMLAGDVGIES